MSEDHVSTPDFTGQLNELRTGIDAIDEQIIALLKRRTALVGQVGELKRSHDPHCFALKPGREARQLRHIVRAFEKEDFSPLAAATIWRTMIAASLCVEGKLRLSIYATDTTPELRLLAQDYFSGFVPVQTHNSARHVLSDLIERQVDVGVFPRFEDQASAAGKWWLELAELDDRRPTIFAVLPFVHATAPEPSAPGALALGEVKPEETGDDLTYLLLEMDESASQNGLQTTLARHGLQARWLDIETSASGRRYHLIELEGFVDPATAPYSEFADAQGDSLIKTSWLGSVAKPIVLGAST